jgi:signal transduction histidine kinase
VISGATELALQRVKQGEAVQERLTEVAAACRRAAVLTRQLLAVSRRQELRLEQVDLNRVATDLEPMLRRLVSDDVELKLELAPEPCHALADPGQLEQVIMNLVINARDAMPTGGELTIATGEVEFGEEGAARSPEAAPGRYAMLSVTDSGCGMDEQTRARIFVPFFSTKEAGKGTGLGLATVYGIVRQSGGTIQVDSEPGHGSTFRVYLCQDPPTADG